MYVITTTPLQKNIFKEELQYFSGEKLKPGTVISVPVRNKAVPALILDTRKVSDLKTAIKSYPFTIRKIENTNPISVVNDSYVEIAEEAADYFAITKGQALASLIPKEVLNTASPEKKDTSLSGTSLKENKNIPWEGPLVLQASHNDRFTFYKGRIREEFAKKRSVILCLPTVRAVENASQHFEKGIQKYIIPLHGKLGKRTFLSRWNAALSEKHPLLIVVTPHYLSIPREDISTIMLDQESSPSYKMLSRPFLDFRVIARMLAKKMGAQLVLGDIVLRTETIYEKERGLCHPRSQVKYKVLSSAKKEVVDMTKDEDEPFHVIHPTVAEHIRDTVHSSGNTFVFVHRKGIATSTTCDDCGSVVLCEKCHTPLVLHKNKGELERQITNNETYFLCHLCRTLYNSSMACKTCGGWRLTPLGIGMDTVVSTLKKELPKAHIISFSSDSSLSHKEALKISTSFNEKPGAILVGTQAALPYLPTEVDTVVVVSLDSLFALPDFRIKERIIGMLSSLSVVARKHFYIQTRNASQGIFSYSATGNLLEFHREEVEERKTLGYPPFYTIIKITREGDGNTIWNDLEIVEKKVRNHKTFIYPAFTSKIRGKERAHLLIKVREGMWPDEELRLLLQTLPPSFIVNVDPSELL